MAAAVDEMSATVAASRDQDLLRDVEVGCVLDEAQAGGDAARGVVGPGRAVEGDAPLVADLDCPMRR